MIFRRVHDFLDEVPNRDAKRCFRLDIPPDDSQGGYAFVPNDCQESQDFDKDRDWFLTYVPFAELKGPENPDQPYLTLKKIRACNRHGDVKTLQSLAACFGGC